MKIRVTKKSIRNNYNVISISYCGAQYLLRNINPFAYSCGVNGWDCDYYRLGDYVISTGYRPIGKSVDYDFVNRYEKAAEKIWMDYSIDYETREKNAENLLADFCGDLKKMFG